MPEHLTQQELKDLLVEQQIESLMQNATARPTESDSMGMVGFMSALLTARMKSLQLQKKMEDE